jgi:hypothetical protein
MLPGARILPDLCRAGRTTTRTRLTIRSRPGLRQPKAGAEAGLRLQH